MIKIVTGKVKFSYAFLFEPQVGLGGTEKYSVSLVIPKEDKDTISKIEKAVGKATTDGIKRFGTKFGKASNFRNPLRDGDEDKPGDKVYENSYFSNVKSKNKPGIVDRNLEEIINHSELYSGCYGRASIVAFPYSVNGSTGVSFALQNIKKLEDGQALGGRSRATDDFSSFLNDDEDDLLG